MTDREMISLAASRGWRIDEEREGRIRWYRGTHEASGRQTKCRTQSVASTMRLIQIANLQMGLTAQGEARP